jgi:hypothetical protein
MAQIDIAQVACRDIKAGSNPDIHKEEKKKHHPIRIDELWQKQEYCKHQDPESVKGGKPSLKHV